MGAGGIIVITIVVIFFLFLLVLPFLYFFTVYIRAFASGCRVSILNLIGMMPSVEERPST